MIVGVSTWRGLGATTTALGVAAQLAARGERPWLVEVDPAGGVLTARLDGAIPAGTLELVAFPAQRTPARERFATAAAHWNGVRVVTAPGDPFRAWACHQPRLPWATALRELDGPVVVDLGRIRGGAPVDDVLRQLDVLLLAVTADVVDIVATTEWAVQRGRCSAADAGLLVDITRLVVVDAPHAASALGRAAIEHELGDRFAGWVPWAPAAVDLLRRGALASDRRLRRQPWLQSVDQLVERLGALVPREVLA